ncbi:1-acyl-sn-glycerol-3-phosphate acyltransferase [Cellulomonas carbonis]|uniref:Acyl-phosphate glycerol 3-phosphate acyltransferase n=1 Tax=Cellulomonas carbonis T26 TaxID=947969 RepID=A0A0A0BUU8_9CELL|nr:1-acyl-sn-glycerol-3-phosphate acyltransferase [Cellulomonas carbonis]KGM11482.1 acyl-phosphate glycerol 3-phosphate acyltransferase [Cellulomonas carbonis T26]GGC04152.1 1-acyl-sn-glycerol-3-phosphate acyltransferase [Cellulomonas carbonis]
MPARRWFARTLLRAARWRVEGTIPRTGIFVGAPHTSNWDFVLTVLVLWAEGIQPRTLVKRELFWWPMGPLLRMLGSVPTERGARGGLVERLTAQARSAPDDFVLVLAADGTRSPTDHWKSGFYRLAQGTGLPVVLAWVDGPTRTVGFGGTLEVTGDVRADMDKVRAVYAGKRGVRPGRGSTPRLREEDAGTAPV